MIEWFRNTEWNVEIEAAFDDRLGRARTKAQYLNIQAYTLLATHPRTAADLSRRALALNDPFQTARAALYLGTALAVDGDFDGAIAVLEEAIEAEQREPMFRTAAYLDQALLVALAKRAEMYDIALARLNDDRAMPLAEQPPSALIAQALIGSERGENVAGVASAALEALGSADENSTALPPYISISILVSRLTAAADA